MAMTKEQEDKALDIIDKFERQIIDPYSFNWNYLIKHVGVSKATMWRKKNIFNRFTDVKEFLKIVKSEVDIFDAEKVKRNTAEAKLKRLQRKLLALQDENDRLRESLAYATKVAQDKNLDPNEFFKELELVEHRT